MKHRIRVGAIIVEDNKLLLVKHIHPKTGYEWWVPPGGGIESEDDSIFDCAKRETFEETNLHIDTSRIVYIKEFYEKEQDRLHIELFVLAENHAGDVSIKNVPGNGEDEDYIKSADWLSREEMADINVFPENLKDTFWDDYNNNFPHITYLGRQNSIQ